MSLERIKQTSIWKSTLEPRAPDVHQEKREELRSAFIKFRENTATLVSRISAVLPDLTQHEITHLDALWGTADLIIGENFELTPLEGFILGGAILIHDSALCFEAYEKGRDGIRETVAWKDSYAVLTQDSDLDPSELEHQADFSALRQLHAFQAEQLLNHHWINPETGEQVYLLENVTLRRHLGKLIGQIASSHHWDIETLGTKLPTQHNALAGYPREWRVDPVKIACILRCADASHIDNERAPDFLYALLKRHGVSFNHWKAQNRLSSVDFDQTEPEQKSLIFNSTIDFQEEDADAWFVAYDAVCLVDRELKSCNSLLEKRIGTSFKAKRVRGAETPEKLSQFVIASGWKPCSAEVHVGNIEKIIQNLGGEMLYGASSDLLGVVVRELVQNARDSIHARKFIDSNFNGEVRISLEFADDDVWLTIEDDGIGMSERVLTGPLLDFGTSFWTSSLVRSEFPGLRASNFKSVGKFGIGFYSIFMIASKVFVTTKSWAEGLSDLKELKFNNGFSMRPILAQGELGGFNSTTSTRVRILLKDKLIPSDEMIEIKVNRSGSENFKVPFKNYLSALVAGLDVKVSFTNNEGSETIHECLDDANFCASNWLRKISFSGYDPNTNTERYLQANVGRLKPIIKDGKIHGLAAINTQLSNKQNFLGIQTVGGLTTTPNARNADNFIGFIDHNPNSAKREVGQFSAGEEVITTWANAQLEELLSLPLNPIEKFCASASLCNFKADPTELAQIMISIATDQKFMGFTEIAELSKSTGIAFLETDFGGHMETHHHLEQLPGYALVRPVMNSSFLSLKLLDGVPENNFSIIDCLYRKVIELGYTPSLERKENVAQNVFGMQINAVILQSSE